MKEGELFLDKNQRKESGFWRRFSWIGVLLIGVLSKFKSLLPLLKLGKFGGTLLSMGVSIFAYAILYPWWFAVGLVAMILIHEMGHVWAAKRKKLPVTAPAFIPFLGALITMKKMPQDAVTEAYIAYGGPLLGTIGALVSYGLGVLTGVEVFYVIALVGFFINLFNLIPIHPLDGGRIVVAISRWIWVLGAILAVVLIIITKSFVLLLIFGLFLFEIWAQSARDKQGPQQITQRALVPTSLFIDTGSFIPGEKHQRSLAFRHYCNIDTQEEYVDLYYPGVGKIASIDATSLKGEIHQVDLVQTRRMHDQLEMYFVVTYTPENVDRDQYYQVTPMVRLKYAVAYFGLAIFLLVMMGFSYLAVGELPIR